MDAAPREEDARVACLRTRDRGGDVEDAEAEVGGPAARAGRRLLEDLGDLLRRQRRVRGPDERGSTGDLRRRERRAARIAVDAAQRSRQRTARILHRRGELRQRTEDVFAWRGERDPGA